MERSSLDRARAAAHVHAEAVGGHAACVQSEGRELTGNHLNGCVRGSEALSECALWKVRAVARRAGRRHLLHERLQVGRVARREHDLEGDRGSNVSGAPISRSTLRHMRRQADHDGRRAAREAGRRGRRGRRGHRGLDREEADSQQWRQQELHACTPDRERTAEGDGKRAVATRMHDRARRSVAHVRA